MDNTNPRPAAPSTHVATADAGFNETGGSCKVGSPEPVTPAEGQRDPTQTERDIRIAIWNGLRASGLNQEFAQIYIRAIMAEPLMQRALTPTTSDNQLRAALEYALRHLNADTFGSDQIEEFHGMATAALRGSSSGGEA